MQMELTYQEAGKPLPKAYDGEEGLIVFTLGRMEEGIMEKLIESRPLRRPDPQTRSTHAPSRHYRHLRAAHGRSHLCSEFV